MHFEKGGQWVSKNQINQPHDQVSWKECFLSPLSLKKTASCLSSYRRWCSWQNLCCCSVTQSCLTLCNSLDCSTPGFPVHHHLPELAQTHVRWVHDAIQPSHPLSLCMMDTSQAGIISFCFFILFVGFLRQEYGSGWPFPSPGGEISGLRLVPRLQVTHSVLFGLPPISTYHIWLLRKLKVICLVCSQTSLKREITVSSFRSPQALWQ